ncbi:MAG: WD40 repeat domain-containing protein [Ktedonobacteraceae bacterium]|nr:WD40 repeat domain-containing protein [Ktedonobacteraceae bacterium]
MGKQIDQSKEDLSRRVILKGLAGLALALGLEGCAQSSTISSPPAPVSTPTPAHRALGSVLYTYNGHSARVTAVAWSPDGKYVASGSLDKTVQIWSTAPGDHFQPFIYRRHTAGVQAVSWSPDGKRIASGSADQTVQIWDAMSGGHVTTCQGHSDIVTTVAWSPDGKSLVSGSADGTVRLWDGVTGKQKFVYRGHRAGVNSVVWSPDSKRFASGSSDRTVQIVDAATAQLVYVYRGHSDTVSAVSWSPDGKRIASGSWDKTVQVWDAATGAIAYTYNGYNADAAKYNQTKGVQADLIFFVAWSHNGRRIAAVTQVYCGDICAVVVIWDAATGGNISYFQDLPVFALAWSPDDTRIATALNLSTAQISQAS